MIVNNSAIFEVIQNAIQDQAVYGASYSLQSNSLSEQHYIGYQGIGLDHIALTSGLEYDLASLTKVIGTTTRILQLLSQKKLALKDEIGRFIPNLSYPELTVEQLLLHDSGLPADIKSAGYSKVELIDKIKQSSLIYQPGTKTVYSDLGFILLGWLIQKIDGDLAQSLQENVFKPLKMKKTGFNLKVNNPKLFVPTENVPARGGALRGTVHDEKAHLLGGISGHAGLFSTLADLNNFVSMYLHQEVFAGHEVLNSNCFSLLKSYYKNGRTLGWQRWVPTGLKIWHTGFTGTSIAIDMDQQTGFVCLTNRIYPTRQNRDWLKWRRLAIGLFFAEPEVI